jgi:hypothetical protein
MIRLAFSLACLAALPFMVWYEHQSQMAMMVFLYGPERGAAIVWAGYAIVAAILAGLALAAVVVALMRRVLRPLTAPSYPALIVRRPRVLRSKPRNEQ